MSRCPKLEVESRAWPGYDYICTKLGIKVGSDYDKTKVQFVCDCDNYYHCPVYNK